MGVVVELAELRRGDVATAGGKGANLGELMAAGLPVPAGFVVTTEGYRMFVEANGIARQVVELARGATDAASTRTAADGIAQLFRSGTVPDLLGRAVADAYAELGGGAVAVRSSATAEDLAEASFAGQQDSYLNVQGVDAVLAAVRDCWASLWTPRAITYRIQQRIDPAAVSLAVVVQELVDADAAGVMFTANPANGRRDQVVIAAAWGLGESVVSGAVDTDEVVIGPSTEPAVLSRRTATKTIQTVRTETGVAQREVPQERRTVPVLSDAEAVQLATLGRAAAAHFGAPQDLEWVRRSGHLLLVQSRPITALPEPEADPPSDWTVPDPRDFYFRASIVEQLPDPLSPLFAELIDPSVTRSVLKVMAELIGDARLSDRDISLPTVNGYAYYRYSRGGMARVSLRTPLAARVLRMNGPRSGVTRWRDWARPQYAATVRRWTDVDPVALSPAELLSGVHELLDAGAEYYTAVQTIIPLAASSEIIFSWYYQRLIRRAGDPSAQLFLLGADSTPIRADKSLWDLATWTRDHPALTTWLAGSRTPDVVRAYRADEPPAAVDTGDWAAWRARLRAHLDAFGHTIYNLDFVVPVPVEEPGPLLDTLRFYLSGQGTDPYARQAHSLERRAQAAEAVRARLDPVRRRVFDGLLRWAQSAGPLREDALADIGLAWPRMRMLLLELGRRLAAAGAVDRVDDVFWLRRAEIADALAAGDGTTTRREQVAERRQQWRGQRRATPPQILPERGVVQLIRRWMPLASEQQAGDVITGIGGSTGQVTSTARVLSGPSDFDQLRPGEILVASITTPAWTPLFAVAGGVVTDIGGPLSHSSIVAREYGIPAVLGTGVATRWARSGEPILVDGDAGTVRRVQSAD